MPIHALVAALTFIIPTAALALGMGPPLSVPAQPDAPPVLDITLPAPPPQAGIPSVPPGMPGEVTGPPFGPPKGIPDLTEIVDLPPEAERVLALAPPFGAPLPRGVAGRLTAVPEPSTAVLLVLGLIAITVGRRHLPGRGH